MKETQNFLQNWPAYRLNNKLWLLKKKKIAIKNHVQFSINFLCMIQKNTKDPSNQPGRKHSETRIVFGSIVIDNSKISDTSRRWNKEKWTWKSTFKTEITISCGVDSLLACVYKKLGVFSASLRVKAFNVIGNSGKNPDSMKVAMLKILPKLFKIIMGAFRPMWLISTDQNFLSDVLETQN